MERRRHSLVTTTKPLSHEAAKAVLDGKAATFARDDHEAAKAQSREGMFGRAVGWLGQVGWKGGDIGS